VTRETARPRLRRLRLSTLLLVLPLLASGAARAAAPALEKDEVKLGFIKLTDCAPLVMAKELGFFEAEGLAVTLEAQANWKILLDRVIGGELDGAQMLAGQPFGATIGIGTRAPVVTAVTLDLNGNAITVSNEVWAEMQAGTPSLAAQRPARPISAKALRPVVDAHLASGEPLRMGMVFPVSTHNYELRYWLAAGGIHPGLYTATDTTGTKDAEVLLSVTPPPQMPATLEQGTIQGYAVGEPWNQQAVAKGIGVSVVTSPEIRSRRPEKVLGVTAAWAKAHPETHVALVKALIRAGKWLDESPENRRKAVATLARPEYVGASEAVISNGMLGRYEYTKTDVRDAPDLNVFFRDHATYPYYADGVWVLTQMRRWGQIGEAKPDAWYVETARQVQLPDVWREAAKRLVAEGKLAATDVPVTRDGLDAPPSKTIDGIDFDAHQPNLYLRALAIGLKD
jgi:nitrate/nitrite transport system substrate-binding protein